MIPRTASRRLFSTLFFSAIVGLSLGAQPVATHTFSARLVAALEEGRRHVRANPPATGRFETAIQEFHIKDSLQRPAPHAIEFVGSSIFRQWTTVPEDMKPLPVFNRAFGGSRTSDQLERVDRVVFEYAPKVIVYYCGSNDVNGKVPPVAIFSQVVDFVEKVRSVQPKTLFAYVSIIKAPQKRDLLGAVDSANALIKEMCETVPGCTFIDVNPALVDSAGVARPEFYQKDQLHLTPPAYEAMTKVIKPVVERLWAEVLRDTPKPQEH